MDSPYKQSVVVFPVRAGVPLRTVQLYAGHAHYTTTEGYAYLAPGAAPAQALRLAI